MKKKNSDLLSLLTNSNEKLHLIYSFQNEIYSAIECLQYRLCLTSVYVPQL